MLLGIQLLMFQGNILYRRKNTTLAACEPIFWSTAPLEKLVGSQLVNKFHNILCDLKTHCCVHKSLLLIPILSHIGLDHAMAFQSPFFKIHFNFILLLTATPKMLVFSVGKHEQESKKKGDNHFFLNT
jgi:hypothetical protein